MIGKMANFTPGEVLFMQGAAGDCMYIVYKGVFGVYLNTFTDFPTKVAEIPIGAFFGEMAVIDGSERSATIISEDEGTALAVDKENFKPLLEKHPNIAKKILATLSSRYASTAKMAEEADNEVAALPAEFSDVENIPPETYYDSMIFFAGKIRELNKLINPERKEEKIEMKKDTGGKVKLLPNGHEKITGNDEGDSKDVLSNYMYVCPYCEYGFKGKIPLISRLLQKEKTPDFRAEYSNLNIFYYNNVVCPNCNYCDYYQEFTKSAQSEYPKVSGMQFPNVEMFRGFMDDFNRKTEDALLSYYLNLECLNQIPNSELRKGKTWQRLFWFYSDRDIDMWKCNAAEQAILNFRKYLAINGDKIKTDEFMTLNIIIGELYCAIEQKKEAMEYFKKNTSIPKYTTHELAQVSARRYRELRNEV